MLLTDLVKKYGNWAFADLASNSPNAHVYYVDKGATNALDANDGVHGQTWENPFATIAYAITRNNAEGNSYAMSTIFVNANTYTESLTVLPKNCNVIAVGARTRITGAHTVAASQQNSHFWNFWFRGSGAYPGITIPSTCYTVGFHGCTFEGTTSMTYSIEAGAVQEMTIEDCQFIGNPLVPTAIHITGGHMRTRIRRNWICATTNGILIDDGTGHYGNLIDNNVITRLSADPNSSEQMAYGIKMEKPTGTAKWLIVNNSIEAVDAIYSATDDTAFDNQCIGNRVNQAGTGAFEDEGA